MCRSVNLVVSRLVVLRVVCAVWVGLLSVVSLYGAPEIVWSKASDTASDIMPLGNGSLVANVAITPDGVIHLELNRADAFDEAGQPIGVSKLQIETGVVARSRHFVQRLTMIDGTLHAAWGNPFEHQVMLKLWVDRNHPVVNLELESPQMIQPRFVWHRVRERAYPMLPLPLTTARYCEKPIRLKCDTFAWGLVGASAVYHDNGPSPVIGHLDRILGSGGIREPHDPLSRRLSGAYLLVDTAMAALRKDGALQHERPLPGSMLDTRTASRHRATIAVTTEAASTPQQWLTRTRKQTEAAHDPAERARRYEAHCLEWNWFWNRSYVIFKQTPQPQCLIEPYTARDNTLTCGVADDHQAQPLQFAQQAIHNVALSETQVMACAQTHPVRADASSMPGLVATSHDADKVLTQGYLTIPQGVTFDRGLTWQGFVKVSQSAGYWQLLSNQESDPAKRLRVDVLDGRLRILARDQVIYAKRSCPEGQWVHLALRITDIGETTLFINGHYDCGDQVKPLDIPARLTRDYATQRYLLAIAGRSGYPIRADGSLFARKSGTHNRRILGAGYPWQDGHWVYYPMLFAGDYDAVKAGLLYYARLAGFHRKLTQLYYGLGGTYLPDSVYFWGDMTLDHYGHTPYQARLDRRPENRWSNRTYTPQLELAGLMLDYYAHTQDRATFKAHFLPAILEYLYFFEHNFPKDEHGEYRFEPMKALDTWFHAVNPTPVIAGLNYVTERLLALPSDLLGSVDRSRIFAMVQAIPPLPMGVDDDGVRIYAPAASYSVKRGTQDPALYPIFPFFQLRETEQWTVARATFHNEKNRQMKPWESDAICAAVLGEVKAIRFFLFKQMSILQHPSYRFPCFWGSDYAGVPNLVIGANLMTTIHSVVLLNPQILPRDWTCYYKLYTPAGMREGTLRREETAPPGM